MLWDGLQKVMSFGYLLRHGVQLYAIKNWDDFTYEIFDEFENFQVIILICVRFSYDF